VVRGLGDWYVKVQQAGLLKQRVLAADPLVQTLTTHIETGLAPFALQHSAEGEYRRCGDEANRVAGLTPGLVRDQDPRGMDLRQLLEPRGDVHRVTDRRVLAPARGADVADDDASGVDTDARAERGLPSYHALDVQLCQLSLHRQRAADGALGVIGLGDQLRNGQPFGPLLVTPRERG
jgi:hypothetical protein